MWQRCSGGVGAGFAATVALECGNGGVAAGIAATAALACDNGGVAAAIAAALAQGLRQRRRWRAAMAALVQ